MPRSIAMLIVSSCCVFCWGVIPPEQPRFNPRLPPPPPLLLPAPRPPPAREDWPIPRNFLHGPPMAPGMPNFNSVGSGTGRGPPVVSLNRQFRPPQFQPLRSTGPAQSWERRGRVPVPAWSRGAQRPTSVQPVPGPVARISCQKTGCPGSGSQCVLLGGFCPRFVKGAPCRCEPGCRVDTQLIAYGQSRLMDQCGNICRCNSRNGQATCTSQRC